LMQRGDLGTDDASRGVAEVSCAAGRGLARWKTKRQHDASASRLASGIRTSRTSPQGQGLDEWSSRNVTGGRSWNSPSGACFEQNRQPNGGRLSNVAALRHNEPARRE